MSGEFKYWEEQGKTPVLLYCGDFDPAGVLISTWLKDNLASLSRAVDWRPKNLIVDRFGLNRDFIEEHGLSWTENLETGSGRDLGDENHGLHDKDYVQDWLRDIGCRKVEANALVIRPEAGRQLCRDAITKYVDEGAPKEYQDAMLPGQDEARQFFREITDVGPWDED